MSNQTVKQLKAHFLSLKEFNNKENPSATELWFTKIPSWINYTTGSCVGITTQPTASGNEINFYPGAAFVVHCGKYADGTYKNEIVYIDAEKYVTVDDDGSYCFDASGNMITGIITYDDSTNLVSVNGTAGEYTKPIQSYTYSDGVVTLDGTIQPDVLDVNAEALINAHNNSSTAHSSYLQPIITGGASTITSSNLTSGRALISNSSGKVAVSSVTSTQLGYLSGVTSSIQTQLNNKQATINGGASTITSSNLTSNRALISNSSGKVAVSGVTSTELGYLDGVTSNIQTQFGNITVLIPSEATSSNQLADKEFVNSSIATNTANFIGTFESITALNSYSGTVTNNDYSFVTNGVITDNGNDWATFNDLNAYNKDLLTNFDYAWVENGTKFDLYRFDIVNQTWMLRVSNTDKADITLNSAYNRYKATVSGNTVTWAYEYTLNNSSFTAEQWAAINSGITDTLVAQISTNTGDISTINNTLSGFGNIVTYNASAFATSAQGALADTALQPSALNGYATETWVLNQGYVRDANVQYTSGGGTEYIDLSGLYVDSQGATYGFSYDSTSGTIKNDNVQVDESFAYGYIELYLENDGDITISFSQDSEQGYDFGEISELDQYLNQDNQEDTDYVAWSGKEYGPISDSITFSNVQAGYHFFTIKYIKDSSSESGTDTFEITSIEIGGSSAGSLIDTNTQEEIPLSQINDMPQVLQDIRDSIPDTSNFVTMNTKQMMTAPKAITGTDTPWGSDQVQKNLFMAVSNSNTTSVVEWIGRSMFGANNLTFLMGTINKMAALGAHSWTSAQQGTGAAWADMYFNPDGDKAIKIGGSPMVGRPSIMVIQNMGQTTTGTVKINRRALLTQSALYKDVACWDDSVTKFDFTQISGYNASVNQTLTHDSSGNLKWVNS